MLSLTETPELCMWRAGRALMEEEGWVDKTYGASPGPEKKGLENELHLHVFLPKIFPGAPQTTDERLCKHKFTGLHNLHVKRGQFSHEVHKPALKQF